MEIAHSDIKIGHFPPDRAVWCSQESAAMLTIALGIAFGVALIPFAVRVVWRVTWWCSMARDYIRSIPARFWSLRSNPLVWIGVAWMTLQLFATWYGYPPDHRLPGH